jgi:hypothetical protein
MRLSDVSLAFVAGMLVLILPAASRVEAAGCGAVAGDGCKSTDEMKTTVFDEARADEAAFVPEARPVPIPSPLDPAAEKLADGESYADVFRVLSDDNSCSRFFGGPARAVTVFNDFARQLRSRSLGVSAVAVRMSGSYTNYRDELTGASYRLFDEATINRNGPFLNRAPQTTVSRMRIGRFYAETRPAKALILLHELGHLVGGPGGKWLLPNDGNNAELSDRNTRTVESHCAEQLLALRD